jgi:cytochrome c
MNIISFRSLFAAVFALIPALASTALAAPEIPPDYRYKVETLLEDIPQPMQVKLAPDGRIFFN